MKLFLEIAIVATVICLIIVVGVIVVKTINDTEWRQIDSINCEV